MKKDRIIILCLLVFGVALNINAQFIKSAKKEAATNWQNLAPVEGQTYGASIDKAREFLKDKKVKKLVTVAIIGPGIDAEHEDLQGVLWQNPKEKENGKDDDKNGKTDDIYGWNYLGSKNGEVVETTLSFADREFFRLQDKYGKVLLPKDGKFIQVSDDGEEFVEIPAPENMDEYYYFKKAVMPYSAFGSTFGGMQLAKSARIFSRTFDKELKEKFPGKEIMGAEFASLVDPNNTDTLRNISLLLTNVAFTTQENGKWDSVYQFIQKKHIPLLEDDYKKHLDKVNIDDRSVIGDNPYDIKDTEYGNNVLMTENAGPGTLCAGIIGAKHGNGLGIDGVADNVRIMTLRTDPSEGDSYPKDVALAIRYAVDNSADIIQLSSSGIIFPFQEQKDMINDALRYATEKGVLIVQPVSNESYNMDEYPFFPCKNLNAGETLDNWITVAASDESGNPLPDGNFGKKSLDLFAPGKEIYSTYTGDTYRSESGANMAGSLVTGVASLIRSYYPDLSAKQVREAIITTVTDRTDAEVEKYMWDKQNNGNLKLIQDLFLFDDLSASNGILNAYEAVVKASGMVPEK